MGDDSLLTKTARFLERIALNILGENSVSYNNPYVHCYGIYRIYKAYNQKTDYKTLSIKQSSLR